ncbi:acetolactate synthase small subunit [Pseudothermotoga thermarum]|uniref:Acetolactate synthase small subunit n=1 Tax=Pseudothermotoga thermarum DSM 5069 TaxID=688269 RepID=F7YV17_9THEM|nr:acetolactate synthase small subunit [Pseudothermotoga thermarum]AEH50301.1 acetolactate synthase, small subunit [Pseudothermotoga thermarum DSM 5069]
MRHILSVLVENHPGVLSKVAGLFTRRGFNIDSLTVGTTTDPTISRMTIVVKGDEYVVEQITKQLSKLIDVIAVKKLNPQETVERELALIKIKADHKTRSDVIQISEIFRANIVDVSNQTLTIEVFGDQDKINAMIELLKQYEIVEMARTGPIALERGTKIITSEEG